MLNLLKKEIKLSASPLSFIFIAFGLMAFLPNYPILVGTFFACFGIFHSFQASRENSDILYSSLLPIRKSDVVKSKFLFCIFIELCAFSVMTASTVVRMSLLNGLTVYQNNVMMNANFVYLAFSLLIFAEFNLVFIARFFKTAYYFAKPFILFIVTAFLTVGIAETLHHVPSLEKLNTGTFEELSLQFTVLAIGVIAYLLITFASVRKAIKSFDKIDL